MNHIDQMGDEETDKCVDYISRLLALTITNIISFLNIDQVILSGKTIILFADKKIVEKVGQFIK